MYDNLDKTDDYINKLEDIKDNLERKICYPFPYLVNEDIHKNIWIIATEEMKNNLSNYFINKNSKKKAITQYFCDITYTCVPKSKFKYKLFIIIGYDILLDKSIMCLMALIMDETIPTFLFLLNKLKDLYKFEPQIITCDFQQSLRFALKYIFPNISIFPC